MPLSDQILVEDTYADLALGFSDLSEDEAFLVWLYRHWQTSAETTESAETEILGRLSRDRIYGCLEAVFTLFRTLNSDPNMDESKAGSPLLTPLELGMLDQVALNNDQTSVFTSCARALAGAGAIIRAPSSLASSDLDRIESRIAGSYSSLLAL